MKSFIRKYAGSVRGVLSGFDRLVLRGSLRSLAFQLGIMGYLWREQVLLKDFAKHARLMATAGVYDYTIFLEKVAFAGIRSSSSVPSDTRRRRALRTSIGRTADVTQSCRRSSLNTSRRPGSST